MSGPRDIARFAIRDGEAWNDRRLPEAGRALDAALDERDEARLAFDAIRIALNVPRTADSPYSPKAVLARVEVICDEAERAFRERDEAFGAGEGSRPSSPVAPDGPESTSTDGDPGSPPDSASLRARAVAAEAELETLREALREIASREGIEHGDWRALRAQAALAGVER